MVEELSGPVVAAGGRFYPAKDAALPARLYRETFRDGQLDRLLELRAELDPDGLLRSGLADRLLYAD
jgi:FAD/FMN-containing dehydrogenase